MRVVAINMVPYGSTGKIMFYIADSARKHGYEVKTYSTIPYRKGKSTVNKEIENHFVFGSKFENKIHTILGVLLGRNGCYSRRGTNQLIQDLKRFNPNIIHLHNLHKFCINLPMLFNYLKTSDAKVVWTLHDCWAFTGKCAHFSMVKCEKWKTGCQHCPQLSSYPASKIDNTKCMYNKKKGWFTGVKNMTLVTPSKWLANLVDQSFLKGYKIEIINNGIDLSIFKPTESNFREKYGIGSKKIILGVSYSWSDKKGLDVFIELSRRLDHKKYKVVLVGTNDSVDKQLSEHILSIHLTHNQTELAEIYSAADIFINPTREDVFPTVNIEALACGTPIITSNTGGSPEILDESCGSIIDCNDVVELEKEIVRICSEKPYLIEACIKRAKKFNMHDKYIEYVELYERLL